MSSTRLDRQAGRIARKRPGAAHAGFGHKHVSDVQRARLLVAMFQVCSELGAAHVTVAHIVERAGVSRRTFYELFASRNDCFLAGLLESLTRLANRVLPAYRQPGVWRQRIRTGLIELLSFLDDEPLTGRLLIVETLGAGSEALRRRDRVLAHVMRAIDEGRIEARTSAEPTPLTAEGVVGGVLAVLHGRLLSGQRGSLLELTNPLMSMIVLPYLGPAAARRELSRTVPHIERSHTPQNGSSPTLKGLDMRLTYRTARVLLAIGKHPGASNRTVGHDAGVSDQGQISKLLARLERIGLIANSGIVTERGAPNAWTLTPRGQAIHAMLGDVMPAQA